MKTQFLVKTAIVAMAAFGAYAFNGNVNLQDEFTRSDTCQDITAECSLDDLGTTCMILVNEELVEVRDSECSKEVKHDNSNPVNWAYR